MTLKNQRVNYQCIPKFVKMHRDILKEGKIMCYKNYLSVGILIFICSNIFSHIQPAYSEEVQEKHRVISLLPNEVKPAEVSICIGTTVVWVNEAPGMVEIQFTNTENMDTDCDSPIRFVRNLEGQFISDIIPFAGIASICFIKKGTFNYTAKRVTTDTKIIREYKGSIIVQ